MAWRTLTIPPQPPPGTAGTQADTKVYLLLLCACGRAYTDYHHSHHLGMLGPELEQERTARLEALRMGNRPDIPNSAEEGEEDHPG